MVSLLVLGLVQGLFDRPFFATLIGAGVAALTTYGVSRWQQASRMEASMFAGLATMLTFALGYIFWASAFGQ